MSRQLALNTSISRPKADGTTDTYDKARINTLHVRLASRTLAGTACIHSSAVNEDADEQTVDWLWTDLPPAQQANLEAVLDWALGELATKVGGPMAGTPENIP